MNEAFYILLEQVKEGLEKLKNNKFSSNQSFDYSKLENLNEKLEQIDKKLDGCLYIDDASDESGNDFTNEQMIEKMNELKQLVKEPKTVNNHYMVDFKSSKTFIVILSLSLVILFSVFLHYKQFENNKKLKANDLKYRFVKIHNGIDIHSLNRLENIFYYTDSSYMIKGVKKLVLDHEHKLEQQIRIQQQIKQNEEKNQKLKKEMEESIP